ncbi:MAG TPA: efflux RND transporter periplasmic adaptor subunit, partial [Steroidobacteraceae bacterium]
PTVITAKPHQGPAADALVLPGSVQAYYEAPIYARTAGYLKAWFTDIGTPVKKGQLLAEIEAPEVDQQLRQAEADLGTARANYELARSTNERWQGLLATESVSQQDADQRAGDAAAKSAAQMSAAANVARLREMEGFKRVVAPFAGVVTQRNTDVGALINAGETPGSALFRVADTHRLRIYVQVPQAYAAQVRTGMSASLEFTDHPGQRYSASVASTAHALDAASRTLQVELQIDNASGELLPGSYVQVTFALPRSPGTLRVPVNAVIFRGKTPQVATVDEAQRVRLRDIAEGRDFGTEIEVLTGINANDTLVLNPPDSIADGQQVRIQPAQPQQSGDAPAAEHS